MHRNYKSGFITNNRVRKGPYGCAKENNIETVMGRKNGTYCPDSYSNQPRKAKREYNEICRNYDDY